MNPPLSFSTPTTRTSEWCGGENVLAREGHGRATAWDGQPWPGPVASAFDPRQMPSQASPPYFMSSCSATAVWLQCGHRQGGEVQRLLQIPIPWCPTYPITTTTGDDGFVISLDFWQRGSAEAPRIEIEHKRRRDKKKRNVWWSW